MACIDKADFLTGGRRREYLHKVVVRQGVVEDAKVAPDTFLLVSRVMSLVCVSITSLKRLASFVV